MNLENHRIPGASDAFYIPNFVTPEEEEYLMRKVRVLVVLNRGYARCQMILTAIEQIIDSPRQKWRYLAHRRCVNPASPDWYPQTDTRRYQIAAFR